MIALLAACGGGEVAERPVATDPEAPATASGSPVGEAPVPEAADPVRGWRRMDIDQLDASIRAATGGIGWDEGDENQFVELAATLGKPDYLTTTFEDLTPGLLFQKFLEDAANAVCDDLVDAEAAGVESPVFFVHAAPTDTWERNAAGIEANLAYLVLRYHGRNLAPGEAQLAPWTFLFEGAELVTGDPIEAWRTVCVGLITHPDFYTY